MSRSSSRGAVLAVALALGVAAVGVPAHGAPGPSAEVRDIVAPVLDITFAAADLDGVTRVETAPRQVRVTLDATVLFGKDSPKLNPTARTRLSQVAGDLATKGPGRVAVTGYTDDLGSAAHGLTLSRQRAAAVASVLRDDLPAAQFPFTVTGKGEADPAAPNTSETNRRKNRRVVVTYQSD